MVSFNSNQSMPANKWEKMPSLKKLICSIPWFEFALSKCYLFYQTAYYNLIVDLSTAETPLLYQGTNTQHSLSSEASTKTYSIGNKTVFHVETESRDHNLATSRVLAQ